MRNFRLLPLILLCAGYSATAQKVTILHTNDTHSIIDPYYETKLGGAMRRMALIDSVRRADPNVLLVDAGDAVQGSLYFSEFKGRAERAVMNHLDYDIQILGNHEFDNGMDTLAAYLDGINATYLSTNYDFSDTPLASRFEPYTIKNVGGKRIGFFAVNVLPDGLIDPQKIAGVKYLDPVEAANAMSWYLRNVEHVDKVVALTHIGYTQDVDLARNTRGIDLVIGGHSHTTVAPSDSAKWQIPDLDGNVVAVVQTGKYGANLGEVVIDFDADDITYRLIPVDHRLDSYGDKELAAILAPYKHVVDSINAIPVGRSSAAFSQNPDMLNWMADFVLRDAERLGAGKPDLSMVNVGGIRTNFPKGTISMGVVMQAFPFDNYEVVLDVPGDALIATLTNLVAKGGNGVSRNVEVVFDGDTRDVVSITLNGRSIDPDKTYRVATINYLAQGNDGFDPLKDCRVIAADNQYLYDAMLNAFDSGFLKKKVQRPDSKARMHPYEQAQ
ncbi:MAG: bifunctional metallophosphatase/5'-nucleotidase [Paramuribaculum sp.]|nr:bifunctional metallophosphatase/5'-nucleotidase [Paramuribaculum sp.]